MHARWGACALDAMMNAAAQNLPPATHPAVRPRVHLRAVA
jgi:hypothetical protein